MKGGRFENAVEERPRLAFVVCEFRQRVGKRAVLLRDSQDTGVGWWEVTALREAVARESPGVCSFCAVSGKFSNARLKFASCPLAFGRSLAIGRRHAFARQESCKTSFEY